MLSIIIPTLNEEKYLPTLLNSIKRQNFTDYEVIVADAGSKDKTVEIAKKYNCNIVPGGSPARGRNSGAKVAKGDVLFFLDADTILPYGFLKNSMEEFKSKELDIAGFCLHPYPPNKITWFLFNIFFNKTILLLENVFSHTVVGTLIKKDLFERLDGYDETIKLAEDNDLSKRASKIAKFGIIRSAEILVSDRRWKQDGWIKTGLKYFFSELHIMFIGPIKTDIFDYKFDHYEDNKK